MFDTFYPSRINGWRGRRAVLCCQDYWSKYIGVYCCRDKSKKTIKQAAELFFKDFIKASGGIMPRRIWQDPGSELKIIETIIERYRLPKDGTQTMIINSQVKTPVNPIEAANKLVQNRMQVFATKNLVNDPELLCEAITYQLNRQPRPDRSGLTPIQLVRLTGMDRMEVNRHYVSRSVLGVDTMKKINIGDRVRYLLWSRKQQNEKGINPITKGFAAKWSPTVHTVLKKNALRNNSGFHAYYLTEMPQMKFRHELQKIPRKLDTVLPSSVPNLHKQLFENPNAPSSAYVPEDESDIESD
jgi:hypothetical protein